MPPDPANESTSARPARPASRTPHSGRASSTTRRTAMVSKSSRSVNTPDMSDDESVASSPDEFASPSESAKSPAQASIKPESEDASGVQDGSAEAPSMPLQKRRRVTRACDECRRKKIKCDGKQPCTHCSVYSYECTYDKPSNRRRNPAPQYIEALEARLQRAETLLRKFIPDVDLADPNLDPAVQQEFRNRERARARAMELKMGPVKEQPGEDGSEDAQIMSMIESIGQLDLKESGEWDFHGISSGAVFLRRMKEYFQTRLGNEYSIPFLPRPALPPGLFSLDSPRSSATSPWESSDVPTIFHLPPLDRVRTLCYYSLDCATCLLRIVHRPSFYEMLDKLYATPQESWGHEEHRFLGLLYSVLALGCVYNVSQNDDDGNASEAPGTYKSAVDEGVKYYTSARLILQDVAECRDMASLQGLVYMILFLQATSNISDCYAFLGIALRSCLRMGLHRHLTHEKITPIEDETRRRVFHVVRQMDFYVSAILGFPLLLHDEDVDQPLPTEVDDEYITRETIRMPPPGTPSFFQAFNAHNRLMRILAKVVKDIYPMKAMEDGMKAGRSNTTFMINYSRIQAIEAELQEWQSQLPDYWRPSHDGPIEVIRVRTLLRFSYAHVQMMLYRPFLHYISPRFTAGKKVEDRYYNCAAAGITVSRNIVHIGIEIRKQAALIGPYWFVLYTKFFAILSLIFFVLENPDKPGSAEILADAQAGRDAIASLAQRSLAADRITSALNPLFEQLPERLKNPNTRPTPTKKRSAPAPTHASRAGSATLPSRPGLQDGTPQRRSDEMIRPTVGLLRRDARGPPQRTSSFDTIGLQHGSLAGQTFTNLQDILPMNMPLPGGGSDSSSPQETMHQQQHAQTTFQHGQATGRGAVSSLYKVDAMMFPSEDPFAYPNQPLMGPATHHHQGSQTSQAGASQSHNAMQFYIPSMYDGIEGQLLDHIPSYLMQQGQRQAHQHALHQAAQMYNSPQMLAMQPHNGGSHGHQQPQHHHQQQQQQQQLAPHPHQHHHQQQGGMMDDILADPSFQGDWDGMLSNTGYQ
ncbi:fungal-specific transcription factor domain-containing protein [Achaetomium macrosporum]|uniref:Fungal-specific transcription factor domain-containing protein n=1 Tax=Achaetomium macrosporum TaxID=79813 RepID=A0AAN7C9J8_9PEZI|nr:fungal-specific transcription factor domain-containing protein [Achaetomium macrosporum]